MKLYNSVGPNPRFVRIFAAEKGIALERIEVDIVAGENRQPAFLAINPAGSTPVLVLDDGTAIAETLAICEFLEEFRPEPPLIGANPTERALTRMWLRRVDLMVVQPMTGGFRGAEGLAMFKDRVRCLPQAADDLKLTAREGLAWFETQLAERDFVDGSRFTIADILLFCLVDFGNKVGQPLDAAHVALQRWRDRVAARDSVRNA